MSDKGTYWALTPYGADHLTTLRAIMRADATSTDHHDVGHTLRKNDDTEDKDDRDEPGA